MVPTKVVIADDHALFRDGVKKILSLEKDILVVGEAARGDEVLKAVERSKPDVLLLDVRMPKGDVVQTLSGSDHYVLLDDETVADTNDLGPLLRKWGVKFGRWTSHKRMHEIGRRVAEEAARWPL
jgi:hypothetical protein